MLYYTTMVYYALMFLVASLIVGALTLAGVYTVADNESLRMNLTTGQVLQGGNCANGCP
jgi:hypothetical protein